MEKQIMIITYSVAKGNLRATSCIGFVGWFDGSSFLLGAGTTAATVFQALVTWQGEKLVQQMGNCFVLAVPAVDKLWMGGEVDGTWFISLRVLELSYVNQLI